MDSGVIDISDGEKAKEYLKRRAAAGVGASLRGRAKKVSEPHPAIKVDEVRSEIIGRLYRSVEARGTLSTDDLTYAIENLGYRLSYNEVLMRFENYASPINDSLRAHIMSDLRQLGEQSGHDVVRKTLCNRNVVDDAILIAHFADVSNPIRDYLSGLSHEGRIDGESPFALLCQSFRDREGNFPLFMRKFLLGCVHRVFDSFQNHTLVLQGAQGLGKSTFAEWLCKGLGLQYFQEGVLLPNDKDHRLRLTKKFLWAVDEFGETFSRSSQNALKAFLTQGNISERPPYGRNEIIARRHCSIIATTNDEKIFTDSTGNRRYLTLNLEEINHHYSKLITPDELWAEVMTWYRKGESPILSAEEKKAQADVNREAEESDSLEDFLMESLVPSLNGYVMIAQLNKAVFTRFCAHGDRVAENQLITATRKIMRHKLKARRVTAGPQAARGKAYGGYTFRLP